MRILIIDDGYPSNDNLYGDVFVHIRVKEYIKYHNCVIVSFTAQNDYFFDGIEVKSIRSSEEFFQFYNEYKPDAVFIHFALKFIIENIVLKIDKPVIIWVHGYEALGWYRRLFNYRLKEMMTYPFLRGILVNFGQQRTLRGLIKSSNRKSRKVHFVFVSNWMKKITEADTLIKVKDYSIVPNPINNNVFPFSQKNPELRKKIFSIRSFYSNKYANDITLEAIRILSQKPFFKDLEFNIYGDGRLWEKLRADFPDFENVKWHRKFLRQEEISKVHKEHGIILCPTRQDAQGVSMCEAMSSGLVPITSLNTAIPEFVEHRKTGFLTTSPNEIAESIAYLYEHPDEFVKMSKNASSSIDQKAGVSKVIEREMEILSRYAGK